MIIYGGESMVHLILTVQLWTLFGKVMNGKEMMHDNNLLSCEQ